MTFAGQGAHLRLLVVHSASKARLDAQKRHEALAKLQQRLAAIQTHLNQRKYKRRDYTWEQIHLAQRGNPAQDLLDITLQGEDGALATHLPGQRRTLAQAEQRDGRYPVLTNCWDLSADEVLEHLKAQDQIEKRFWVLKGPLQVHPLWLHKDERLVSLVLVLMIALWSTVCWNIWYVRPNVKLRGGRYSEPLPATRSFCCASQMAVSSGLFQNSRHCRLICSAVLNFPAPQMSLMLV